MTRLGSLNTGTDIFVGGGGASQAIAETRTAAAAATIDASVKSLRTAGYAAPGDGGHGLYKRLQSAPAALTNKAYFRSIDRVRFDGTTDATHGGYWVLVPEGGEVRVEQFGGKADWTGTPGTSTNSYQPLRDAIDFIARSDSAVANYSNVIKFGVGKYYIGQMVDIHTMTWIKGCGNGTEATATDLYFPSTTTCFLLGQNNTSGETGTGSNMGQGGGTVLEGFAIRHYYATGGFNATTFTAKYGVHCRTQMTLKNIVCFHIAGHAFLIHGNSGGGGALEGAPNEWRVTDCMVHSCGGHALCVYGADSNAGSCVNFSSHTEVGGCGIYDASYFANSYTGIHISGYGYNNKGVHHGGRRYILIAGSPVENPSTLPNTTTPGTNNTVWYDVGAGIADSTWLDWDAGGDYSLYRLPIFDTGGGRTYTAPYTEAGMSHVALGSIVVGGTNTLTRYSLGYLHSPYDFLSAPGGMGTYLPFNPGTAEQTRNGDYSWVVAGRQHEEHGFGANGGMQFISSRRQSPSTNTWQFGYAGNDIQCKQIAGKVIFNITTPATTQDFGTGTAFPHMIEFHDLAMLAQDNGKSRIIGYRGSAPASGAHAKGEIYYNTDPVPGGFIGWVCTTAGTPGTWKTFGVISA